MTWMSVEKTLDCRVASEAEETRLRILRGSRALSEQRSCFNSVRNLPKDSIKPLQSQHRRDKQ
eukprot:1703720-Amphidinium_carterae.1